VVHFKGNINQAKGKHRLSDHVIEEAAKDQPYQVQEHWQEKHLPVHCGQAVKALNFSPLPKTFIK
jgi:hypothetical protein